MMHLVFAGLTLAALCVQYYTEYGTFSFDHICLYLAMAITHLISFPNSTYMYIILYPFLTFSFRFYMILYYCGDLWQAKVNLA